MIWSFHLIIQQCFDFLFRTTVLQYVMLVIGLLFVQNVLQNRKRKADGLPPGPVGFPLVGSLPYIAKRPYKTFTDMARRYGDVFSLQLGTQNTVVINNQELLKEAFVRNGEDFAGRPPLTVFQFSSKGGRSIAFTPMKTKSSRVNRKLGHAALHKFISDINRLDSLVSTEVEKLQDKFTDWVSRPFNPSHYVKNTTANIMISLVFGKTLDTTYRDEFMELSKISTDFTRNLFVASIVDIAPCLSVVFKERLAKLQESINKLFGFSEKIFELQKEKELGQSIFSVVKELVETAPPIASWYNVDPESIQTILTDILGAGVDTTSTAIVWGINLLARYQNIQSTLHEELDSVLGRHTPLRLRHKQNLPKLEATILEVLRIKPPLPLALPHFTLCDTILGGYKIPKETMVIANIWGINHDPKRFENPFEFNPLRFINEEGAIETSHRSSYPFSVGFRKCIGLTLAKQLIFLILGSLLNKFKFTLSAESQNETAGDNEEFTFIMQPKQFKVVLETR